MTKKSPDRAQSVPDFLGPITSIPFVEHKHAIIITDSFSKHCKVYFIKSYQCLHFLNSFI